MKFLTAYGERNPVRIVTTETGAKQSFAKECDINGIMKKYHDHGIITHAARHQGRYGFAPSNTYQEAMMLLTEARSQFADLPSGLRNHFGDIDSWLAFAYEHGDDTPEALDEILNPPEPAEGSDNPGTPLTTPAPSPSSGSEAPPAPQTAIEAVPDGGEAG